MYGRARRIAFAKKCIVVVVIILIVFLVIKNLFNKTEYVDYNQNFNYLKSYFVNKGYTCKVIENVGGRCFYKTDNSSYSFIRYDDGFNYVIEASNYRLVFNHNRSEPNKITFKTNNESLSGYKNKVYYCATKGTIIDELLECKTDKGEKLDLDGYIGIVEDGIQEVNDILIYSGYNVDSLLKDFEWKK